MQTRVGWVTSSNRQHQTSQENSLKQTNIDKDFPVDKQYFFMPYPDDILRDRTGLFPWAGNAT